MMGPDQNGSDFFVAGGTLRPDSPSYVERASDEELYDLARSSEFCYVLTARQMGKSSLMIRTARRLHAEGIHSVIIDLTKIGIEVTVDQWYLGLLSQLKRKLKLSVDLDRWWQERTNLGYVQRFSDFLHDVLLEEIQGQVVIFMDEIDTTLNLAFSDDFFAAIRFIYNARATDSAFQRLTFVLLGVATPQDLIKDRNRTPFNIGQGIDLNDFSHRDAAVLEEGLIATYPAEGRAIFDRIFYWTHGHPYLTQKLCLTVTEMSGERWTDERLDQLVERLFLSKEARKETNLQFVRDSVENNPRRSQLLKLYRKVYTGKAMPEDKRSLDQTRLKLYGLVRVENNLLAVRNQIYRRAFNLDWIRANMPVDWSRRVAVASVAIVLVLLTAFVFFVYYWQGARLAQSHINTFRTSPSSNERIAALAGLFDLTGYADDAENLFYEELSPEERLILFQEATPQTVGGDLITVVRGLYTTLENNEQDNTLLEAMVQPLEGVEDTRASKLTTEINQWLQGREYYEEKDYQQAVTVYGIVIDSLNDRNPGIYYDRGLAYLEQGENDEALADFEAVLKLNKRLETQIQQLVTNNADLYDAAFEGAESYAELVAVLPSPTSTPTSTSTSTSTPTPTATPSPAATATTTQPAPPATAVESVPETTVVTATPMPTSTNTPAPTPTLTITPTPTPRPATVVFVQSSGQNHDLGLVSSSGELLNASLHRRAAAPAWSPDGRQVAFYGEPGLSEFGGIYSQGSGLWLIEVLTGQVELLRQIDHITGIAWSPDGSKLAFEIGPPGVAHQVYIVDARDGKEISRFAGEQPAWKPNGQELAVKACSPECGLWQVGLDGGGGKLLTNDGTDSYPTWSPTGEHLVFTSRARSGDWEICRLGVSDGELRQLTERPGTDTTPVFSPDGREIYFRTDAFGTWEVRAMAADGSNERVVRTNVGHSDDWGRAKPAVN